MLGPTNGFEMLDALPGAQTAEDLAFLILELRRDDDGNRLSDGFVGGKSENAFCSGVPAGDDAVEVFGDDGVVGRLDDGRKPVLRLLR
jgi:hypothetical protein